MNISARGGVERVEVGEELKEDGGTKESLKRVLNVGARLEEW